MHRILTFVALLNIAGAQSTSAQAITQPTAAAATVTFQVVPGQSRASYSVDEVFLRENNRLFTAVGVTTGVSGEIQLDMARPASSRIPEITVDLRPLRTDSDRRDRAVRLGYLHTDRYPNARLTNAVLDNMPASFKDGERFSYNITGDLAVHGVTRRTSWRGVATLDGETLRGSATTRVKMSSFGIEVPNMLSLRSEDDVLLEIQFVARKSS